MKSNSDLELELESDLPDNSYVNMTRKQYITLQLVNGILSNPNLKSSKDLEILVTECWQAAGILEDIFDTCT